MTAHVLTAASTPLPWDELVPRVAAAEVYWLSCPGGDGAPHTRPVLGVWADDAFHCCLGPRTVKGRLLGRDSRCSVALRAPDLDVVLTGRLARVRDDGELRTVAAAYESKYGWSVQVRSAAFWADGAPTAGAPPFHVLRLVPGTVHAFPTSDELGGATRWELG